MCFLLVASFLVSCVVLVVKKSHPELVETLFYFDGLQCFQCSLWGEVPRWRGGSMWIVTRPGLALLLARSHIPPVLTTGPQEAGLGNKILS